MAVSELPPQERKRIIEAYQRYIFPNGQFNQEQFRSYALFFLQTESTLDQYLKLIQEAAAGIEFDLVPVLSILQRNMASAEGEVQANRRVDQVAEQKFTGVLDELTKLLKADIPKGGWTESEFRVRLLDIFSQTLHGFTFEDVQFKDNDNVSTKK